MSQLSPEKQSLKEIMIVAGEASGDLHGANLVKAVRKRQSNIHFCGMGGPELDALGVELLYDAQKVAVVGLVEVISHLPSIFEAKRILSKRLKANPPALLIIIDLPDFNLMLAKTAKQLGIPVFYYITPQVWAWRSGRVKTIGQRVDKLGVILPFEENFFKERGLEAEYVGHPLLDHVKTNMSKEEFFKLNKISQNQKVIGLLPGSRSKEISSLLPDLLDAAALMQERSDEKLTFLLPQAPTISREELEAQNINYYEELLDLHVIKDNRYELMASCDAVAAVSGTVTLELAILSVPMVVIYRGSPISYWIGKKIVDIPNFSLVNLIAEKEVVKELLQDEVSPESIADEVSALLDGERRTQVIRELARVNSLLGSEGASERAASVVLEMI